MATFSFPIHRMTPKAPRYNVLETQMEGWTVKKRLKSTVPIREWDIEIRGRTNAERDEILSHYNGQNGSLTSFSWVVPSFFGGNTFNVFYKEFAYVNPEGYGNVWNFSITFVEAL